MLEFISRVFSPLTTYNGVKLNGYIPDEPDSRDIPFSALMTAVGAPADGNRVDFRPLCSIVENQSSLGSCVTNAIAGGLEYLERKEGLPKTDLARLFLYYNCRAAEGTLTKDTGTHIRTGMMCLTAQGICPESLWPYDISKFTVRPSWSAYRLAYGHKIRSFYRISGKGASRIQQIEQALLSGNPVVFGARVYQNFMDLRTFNAPMPGGSYLGRHAMLIVGFDRNLQYFIVRNSWGVGWGEFGYCAVPYSWLDACDTQDVWCMTKYGV